MPGFRMELNMAEPAEHKGAGHRERLRQRFLEAGLDAFLDYEVIELLLTLGTPRRDCKDAAKAVLRRFKTLQGALEADPAELQEVPGVGPKNAIGLRLVKSVCDRYLAKKVVGREMVANSQDLLRYLTGVLRDRPRECFLVVYLDAKNRVIALETLSEGTLTASSVYPREVIRSALQHHAAALIFAHNHPSGEPRPSEEDLAVTRQLVFAARVMGLVVHEHLIIGDNRCFSFADEGYIARMNSDFGADRTARP
jgi:DNA repair protein RadC